MLYIARWFTLAHLSDPHLAPLPAPRLSELFGKRITGYINWRRKRRFIHDRGVLDTLTADLKAQTPDHIAVTGDIANIALRKSSGAGATGSKAWARRSDVSFIPGNHDIYVPEGGAFAARQWAAYMARRRRQGRLPLRAPARTDGADRPLERRADRAVSWPPAGSASSSSPNSAAARRAQSARSCFAW